MTRRLTEEEIHERIRETHGDAVVMVEYAGKTSDPSSRFRCTDPECGHTWSTTTSNVCHKTGCRRCGHTRQSEALRLTEEEIHERIREKHGDAVVMTRYGGGTVKMSDFKCADPECGHTWSTTTSNVCRKTGCRRCANRSISAARIMSEKQIHDRIGERHGQKIVMTRYGGSTIRDRSDFKCTDCGYSWSTTAQAVYRQGSSCAACKGLPRRTEDEVHALIRAKHGTTVVMIGYAGNMTNKSNFECGLCGRAWLTSVTSVASKGSRCIHCFGNPLLSEEQVRERIMKHHEGRIVLVRYAGSVEARASEFSCTDCGYEWSTSAISVYSHTGCRACAQYGYDPTKPGTLYYVKVLDTEGLAFFKIGITNADPPMDRFANESAEVELVRAWKFEQGSEALDAESAALNRFASFNAGFGQGDGPLRAGGNTELFTVDLLDELELLVAGCMAGDHE